MFRARFVPIVITAILLSVSAFAGNTPSPSFTTIDNPGDPTFNQLLGINDNGVIVGYFGSGAPGHPNQGYSTQGSYTTFTPENLPGSVQTQVTGINKTGTTVGFWAPTNAGGDMNFGFVRLSNGFTYLSVNNPLGAGAGGVDQLLGINASNIAVGFYIDGNGNSHGYTYTVGTGVYSPVTIANSPSVAATGINAHNLICGFFLAPTGITKAFLKPLTGGTGTTFFVPGASVTQFLGVNDSGVAVGFYVDAAGLSHGLTYNPANGEWNTVDNPIGVLGNTINGINNSGDMVGFYTDANSNTHGMLVTGM